MMMSVSLILFASVTAATSAAPGAANVSAPTCNAPVYMVVEGETLDRARMGEYAQAIAASEIYQKLGGYYVTLPRPIAVFEGDLPSNYVNLTVRFPCLANAKAFWNSRVYQGEIIRLRQDPSAGDYTVSIYAEAPLRPDMLGKVEGNAFTHDFSNHAIPQVESESSEGETP